MDELLSFIHRIFPETALQRDLTELPGVAGAV
jgi:hypothetical protein